MRCWVCWLFIDGPVRGISPDGRVIADQRRVYEWHPDGCAAEGW